MRDRSTIALISIFFIGILLISGSMKLFNRTMPVLEKNGTHKSEIIHKTHAMNRIVEWESFRSTGNVAHKSISGRTQADEAFLARFGHSINPLVSF